MMQKIKKAYIGVFDIIGRYWRDYGSWSALVFSPFFHIAILFTIFLSHFWLEEAWWDVALSVLPNIIGFALGGYAIWLGFGDEQFRRLISEREDNDETSPYLQVSAAFAHFIIVQLVALCSALIAKATNFPLTADHWISNFLRSQDVTASYMHESIAPIFYGIGFLLFVYALMTAVAATLAVLRVASWFDKYRNPPSSPQQKQE